MSVYPSKNVYPPIPTKKPVYSGIDTNIDNISNSYTTLYYAHYYGSGETVQKTVSKTINVTKENSLVVVIGIATGSHVTGLTLWRDSIQLNTIDSGNDIPTYQYANLERAIAIDNPPIGNITYSVKTGLDYRIEAIVRLILILIEPGD